MQPLIVREFERIHCGSTFDPGARIVTPKQRARLEAFNEDHRRRWGVVPFAHGPRQSLVAQSFVGIVDVGRAQIEILPKIEGGTTQVRGNLARMIAVALELDLHGDRGTQTAMHEESVLEVLVRLFCAQLWQAVRRGMIRRYELRSEELAVLRGKLDVPTQVRRNLARPDRLHCRFDEFTDNNEPNRALKAALRLLHRVSRSPTNLRSIAELLFCFQDVDDAPAAAIRWQSIAIDRMTARYEPLLRLASLFLEGSSPDVITGEHQGFALLFDMNELFEAYVGAVAKKVFGRRGLLVTLQGPRKHLARHENGTAAFALRPDIVVRRAADVVAIVDTKWKRLRLAAAREGVSSADAYQMHAYATQFGSHEVMLLYPHHAELGTTPARRAEYSFHELGAMPGAHARKVSVATIDLANLDDIGSQLEGLFPNVSQAQAAA